MARPILLLLPLFLAGCPEQGVKAFNAEPEAEITSHGDGDEVLEGYIEVFRGGVSDPDQSDGDLTATWYLDDTIICESAAPDGDGIITCEALVPADATTLTLEVQDPVGADPANDLPSLTVIVVEAEAIPARSDPCVHVEP